MERGKTVNGFMLTSCLLGCGWMITALPGHLMAKDTKTPKAGEEKEYLKAPDDAPKIKVFSKEEKRILCGKVEGSLISFAADVFLVERCKRRPVNSEDLSHLSQNKKGVQEVTSSVIVALELGEPLTRGSQDVRSCRSLEGQFVTYSWVDIYLIEQCKKRALPDWETYSKYKQKLGKSEIKELTWKEFYKIQPGENIRSVVDDMFQKILAGDGDVEVIPVDEACKGLSGKVVSFHGKVYKIEKCQKREALEPDLWLKESKIPTSQIVELKSQVWISLPEGQPIVTAHKTQPDPSIKIVGPQLIGD